MTEPVTENGRPTRIVPVKGRSIVVRQLMDTQMVHLLRHSRILQKDDVAVKEKLDSVERIFTILETMIVQQEDRDYMVEMEEAGEIELKDLMAFITAFQGDEPEKPRARRGRPPKSLQR